MEINNKTPIILPRRKKHSLMDFFLMKEQEVLDKFASLPNAEKIGSGDQQFVYIPGSRNPEDRVLLVSHADTVWNNEELNIGYRDGKYFSLKKGIGIGADDRAGCCIAWKLRDLGHSILIPNGEETGCQGSRFLMNDDKYSEIINNHRFAIEFDRRGDADLVFYSVGSTAFTEWCEAEFKGYKKASGSWTDIGVLCKKICGLNISVGYYSQHSDDENLIVSEWNRTLSTVRNVLSKKGLPQFLRPEPVKYCDYQNRHNDNVRQEYSSFNEHILQNNRQLFEPAINHSYTESLLICPYCDCVLDLPEWRNNGEKCISCGKAF